MRHSVGVALATALWFVASTALAAPSAEDKALSTQLFQEGRQLMQAGKIAEACAKFEESERLVPADGTALNVAVCNEKRGLLATAYAAFIDARARALASGRKERVQFADEHIKAIEPRLSRLTIVVRSAVEQPNLRVFRDGSEIGPAAWGTAMPVDPGVHVIEARAPGKRTWTRSIEVGSEGDLKTIELEDLEPEEPPVTEAPAPPALPPKAPPVAPAPRRAPRPRREPAPGQAQRNAAYVLGGVGLVGLGIGSYFGLRAFSKWSESDDACRAHCNADGEKAANDARTAADISTVAFVTGGVALGVGTWLFLSSESGDEKRDAVWARAGYGAAGPAGTLGGRF